MRRWALCAMTAAVLAGCGGSDPDDDGESRRAETTTTGSGSSAADGEYVRRVDALCQETRPQLAAIRRNLTQARDETRAGRVRPQETFNTFSTLLRRAGDITERFLMRLRAVEPQGGEREFHRSLVASIEQGSSNLRQQVRAAERQDAGALRTLSINGSVISSRQKGLIAGHGGFRHCSRE